MDRTVELRWFSPGAVPRDVVAWFDAAVGSAPRQEGRTDVYLCLPGTESLGVKLRDDGDRLEIKLRERELGPIECPGGVVGNVEQWQKWSWPTSDCGRLALPPEVWLEVGKTRRLVNYELAPDGWGCQIELTALRVGGEEWWTLGFEGLGSGESSADRLRRTASAVFDAAVIPVTLEPDGSQAYPAWLARMRP